MNIHKNAHLTPIRRAELARAVLEDGCSFAAADVSFGVTAKTAAKWVRQFVDEGEDGLTDRLAVASAGSTSTSHRRSQPHRDFRHFS